MKAIQVTLDEQLLSRLDQDEEVRRAGRSAVIRAATRQYLDRRRRRAIAEAYRKAYARGAPRELSGWAREASWPDD